MPRGRRWWDDLPRQVRKRYQAFREGRLYVQVILTLVLLAVTGLVSLFPVGPLARVHEALTWTATHDSDFVGQARAVRAWVAEKGGIAPATATLWRRGKERIQDWAGSLRSRSEPEEPPTEEAEPEQPPEDEVRPTAPPAGSGWIMPVDGSVMNAFGWLSQDVQEEFHNGIDILALRGSPVVAVADGRVLRVGQDPNLGELVEVEHGDLVVLYAQLEGRKVKARDRLKQGDVIGAVGNPVGNHRHLSPHLHLEVRPKGSDNPVDPIPHLPLGGKPI